MALYLDLDLDYFIHPVIKESISNRRPSNNSEVKMESPELLLNMLKLKGIQLGTKRFMFTNHMQSHLRWWINGKKNNTVIHIDAHSDLYGHHIPSLANLKPLGCQNYLWHSVRDGFISEIYWVFPDNLIDLNNPNLLDNMFSQEQVVSSSFHDKTLSSEIKCILPGGSSKIIPLHILTAESLPYFGMTTEIITIATSPEFIPRQADQILSILGDLFHIEQETVNKVISIHEDMPDILQDSAGSSI